MTTPEECRAVLGPAMLVTPETVARWGPAWPLDVARVVHRLEHGPALEPEVAGLLGGRWTERLGELADYCGVERCDHGGGVLVWRLHGAGDPRWARYPPVSCIKCGAETIARFQGIGVHPHCLGLTPRVPPDQRIAMPESAPIAPLVYAVVGDAVGLPGDRPRVARRGERVELTEDAARRLVQLGAIVGADDPAAPPPPSPRPAPIPVPDPPRRDAGHRFMLRDDGPDTRALRAEGQRYLHDLVLATIHGGRDTPPGIGYHPTMRAWGHKTPGENAAEAMRHAGPNQENAR